jgi:hypothetical protein
MRMSLSMSNSTSISISMNMSILPYDRSCVEEWRSLIIL